MLLDEKEKETRPMLSLGLSLDKQGSDQWSQERRPCQEHEDARYVRIHVWSLAAARWQHLLHRSQTLLDSLTAPGIWERGGGNMSVCLLRL